MEAIRVFNYVIAIVFFICYFYQLCYIPISLIKKSRTYTKKINHRFAVLICARNEETVIGQLIESVLAQNYPAELIDIYVAADNCTDSTAEVARKAGANVYERFDKTNVGKGYALNFLIENIVSQHTWDKYDGYFVFDADNLLDENYISEMNKAFSSGNNVVTGYRNSKNYGSNWISAGYSLWFLRESKYLNNVRSLLSSSCAISGTGFLFSREIIKKAGGWNFFLLTEDIEFTVYNVLNGEKIGYCSTAVLYDEQPLKFSQSLTQRMRWAKGYLQVFRKHGKALVKNVFTKLSFSCFDMCMTIMPAIILTTVSCIVNLAAMTMGVIAGQNFFVALQSVAEAIGNAYLLMFLIGLITTISEWKHIHTTTIKKILYTFTFPLFMFTYIPISFIAMFKKVTWQPIRHTECKTLNQLKEMD